jgi:hypothetical protein
MQLSSHGELIAVMAELWTLLNTLAIVEPGALRLPSSDTGIHPKSTFHADAALAAGFHPKAVAVMSALPYLHTDDWDPFELEGSTFPMSYLHSGEDDFADSRKMFSHDNIMPPSAFRLTWQDVNGWDYIYDVEKSQSPFSSFSTQKVLATLLTCRLEQGSYMSGITTTTPSRTTFTCARCRLARPSSR